MRIDFSKSVLIIAPFAAVAMIYTSGSRPKPGSPYGNYHPPYNSGDRFGQDQGRPLMPQHPFGNPQWHMTLTSLPLEVLGHALNLAPQQRAEIGKILKTVQSASLNGSTPEGGWQMMRSNDEAGKKIETLLTPSQWDQIPKILRDAETFRSIGLPLECMEELALTASQRMQLAKIARSRPFQHNDSETSHQIDPEVLSLLTSKQCATLAALANSRPKTEKAGHYSQ